MRYNESWRSLGAAAMMLLAVACSASTKGERPKPGAPDATLPGTGGSPPPATTGGSGGSGGTVSPTGGTGGEMPDSAPIVATEDAAPDTDTLPTSDGGADVEPADATVDLGPPPAHCGDHRLDPGEDCDDGPMNSAAAYGAGKCTDRCKTAPFCGDSKTNRGEQCDDGAKNANGRDNYTAAPPPAGQARVCNADCRIVHFCGDKSVEADRGEKCDNGSMNAANAYGRGACTDRCQPAPFCGDHTIDGAHGEQCDDGADNGKAPAPGKPGCSSDCKVVAPGAICGDHHVDSGEECDEGSGNRRDNGDYSDTPPAAGQVLCNSQCKKVHFCGDGHADQGHEQCDEGAMNAADAGDYSAVAPPAGHQACNHACKVMHFCGDGHTDQGHEQCDLGADNGKAPAAGATGCSLQCTPIVAPSTCGNGSIEPGEECDNGGANVKSDDVYTKDTPASGMPACNQRCKAIHFCGDKTVERDQGELCDNGAANSNTASSGCTKLCHPPACGDGLVQDHEACDPKAPGMAATCDATCKVKPAP
jgi:hypothetical protein